MAHAVAETEEQRTGPARRPVQLRVAHVRRARPRLHRRAKHSQPPAEDGPGKDLPADAIWLANSDWT